MRKKVTLITGANGEVGHGLIQTFAQLPGSHPVVVLDIRSLDPQVAGLVEDCIAAVRAGGSLVIFPEGTRSVPGQSLRLQRGAANIAVRGELDVTPVHIRCSPATLGKEQKWYRVPPRRFHVRIEVGEDIQIHPFLADTPTSKGDALAARRLTNHLTHYFDLAGDPNRAGT